MIPRPHHPPDPRLFLVCLYLALPVLASDPPQPAAWHYVLLQDSPPDPRLFWRTREFLTRHWQAGNHLAIWVSSDAPRIREARLAVRVPPHYPAPVQANKKRLRARVAAYSRKLPPNPIRLGPAAEDSKSIRVELLGPGHELDGAVFRVAGGTPLIMGVVLDLSNSAHRPEEGIALVQRSYCNFLRASQLVPGSRFRIYGTGSFRHETMLLLDITIGPGEAGYRLSNAIARARGEIAELNFPTRPHASALAEALHFAVSELSEFPGTHALYVLSDLRQTTPGVWHFESAIPSKRRFLDDLRTRELLPDLTGYRITVLMHERAKSNGEAFTAREAQVLRELWQAYFRTCGARARLYRHAASAFADPTITHPKGNKEAL